MVKIKILLVVVMLLAADVAYAAPAAVSKTGQTTSYAAEDDGDVEKGVAWPEPRFTVSGDCVTDLLTGLMWAKNAYLAGLRTWQGALDYIASLNSGEGLGGYTDWRLPNRKELRSLVNYGQYSTATWLKTQGFINVQSYNYWSSTTCAGGGDRAWIVHMGVGYVGADYKTYGYCVWPVRSGQ